MISDESYEELRKIIPNLRRANTQQVRETKITTLPQLMDLYEKMSLAHQSGEEACRSRADSAGLFLRLANGLLNTDYYRENVAQYRLIECLHNGLPTRIEITPEIASFISACGRYDDNPGHVTPPYSGPYSAATTIQRLMGAVAKGSALHGAPNVVGRILEEREIDNQYRAILAKQRDISSMFREAFRIYKATDGRMFMEYPYCHIHSSAEPLPDGSSRSRDPLEPLADKRWPILYGARLYHHDQQSHPGFDIHARELVQLPYLTYHQYDLSQQQQAGLGNVQTPGEFYKKQSGGRSAA